jgi:dihydropyrimidinase
LTQLELVLKNGTVVTPAGTRRADVGIREGRIAALEPGLEARENLDATGLLVLPGAVDPHVHLQMPAGSTLSSDDWETGTRAAAHGGTTTVIDFVEPEPDEPLLEALAARRAEAEGRAVIDYGLHMTLARTDAPTLEAVPEVVAAGVTSFKTYTTYEGFRLDDAALLEALSTVAATGGLTLVHAESDAITQRETARLLAAGQTAPRYHPLSRPAVAEAEAVQRVLALAEVAGAPVYIVHVSTARAAAALAAAQVRGQEAYGETCPQYLLLTAAEYGRPGFEGAKFVCSPPLRSATDGEALWQALGRGTLQTLGTDHCPFNYEGQKDLGRDAFDRIPGGLPSIEARLALLYTFGVRAGRLSLERWVELCAGAPARLFGLFPRKGALQVGADADVVLFDPEKRVTLTQALLHERVDYTPYEGLNLQGYPVTTLVHGQVIVREGQFVGDRGGGRFLERPVYRGHAKEA